VGVYLACGYQARKGGQGEFMVELAMEIGGNKGLLCVIHDELGAVAIALVGEDVGIAAFVFGGG
jgi:hypothetical protein